MKHSKLNDNKQSIDELEKRLEFAGWIGGEGGDGGQGGTGTAGDGGNGGDAGDGGDGGITVKTGGAGE